MPSTPANIWPDVQAWLIHQALPLWATAGFDAQRNTFQERLSLTGEAIDQPRRLMVQARQIYVYATAHQHGWMDSAQDIVARATDAMIRDYFEADDQAGWVFSVDAQGRVIDATRDLYAHAFALFGLAAAYRATGNSKYLDYAQRTMLFLDTYMAAPAGGYLNSYPQTSNTLYQDPHMHLLEALMALHACDPDRGYDTRASNLVRLFVQHMFQFKKTVLMENFDLQWKPLTFWRERFFEPGHHYQWVWLLDRYQHMTGTDMRQLRQTLAYAVERHGISPQGYLLWEEVRADGGVVSPAYKLWPHAEAIKAALTATEPNAGQQADMWLSTLYNAFLKPAHPGGWFEKIDLECKADTTYMPASAFYHIACALSEYALRRAELETDAQKHAA